MKPRVTIAICTRNRPADLRRCLTAARRVRGPIREILVVDNAPSNGETRQVAEEYQVRYVCEPVAGLHHARNRALQEARGYLIAYTDDDCEPEPDWVEALVEAFADPAVACVTGKAISGPNPNHVQRQFESLSRSFCVDHEVKTCRADVGRFWYRGVHGVGANMAVRRDFLLACGGCKGPADDDYIFFNILRSGGKLCYTPHSVVRERHRSGLGETLVRYHQYGVGAIGTMWVLGAEDGSLRTVLENSAWLMLVNCRQVTADFLRFRGTRVLFGLAHLSGLVSGTLFGWREVAAPATA
jgi:glycosyltransferase involved in cell wall biosynthesis